MAQTRNDGSFNTVTASRGIFHTLRSDAADIRDLLFRHHSEDITTATRDISPSESGTTFYIKRAAGSTITLPPPSISEGLNYRFIISSNPITGNVDIISPTIGTIFARAYGPQVTSVVDYAGAVIPSVGFTTFRFVANNSGRSDDVEFVSDGTFWYAKGVAALATGIAFV